MLDKQTFRRGFQFRLRSDTTAESRLRQWSGCCRKVWNLALAEQQARRVRGEKYAGYLAMAKRLTEWRKAPETEYLADVPIHVLQNVLKSLDEAFQDFFKKAGGYPKFKCYGQEIGLRETDIKCFAVDNANGRIKFPKLGWLRYRKSRGIEGTPKIVTITRQPNGWHVSIMTETQIEQPVPVATTIGAGDRGITNFLATDTGRLVAPLNAHRKVLVKLRRYQRAVARKMEAAKIASGIPKNKPFPKGFKLSVSNRLRRAQARVAKVQHKVACVRTDFLHKLSTEIADQHAVFCIEDLKVKNMSASSKGTAAAPGKMVAQKSGLNRSILDQGWSMWATWLEYKLNRRGGQLIKVNPAYSSQRCTECGHTHAGNRKGEKFKCLACGHEAPADINAARNILAAGEAVLAREWAALRAANDPGQADVEGTVQSGRPMKRQPANAEGGALCIA